MTTPEIDRAMFSALTDDEYAVMVFTVQGRGDYPTWEGVVLSLAGTFGDWSVSRLAIAVAGLGGKVDRGEGL